MQLKISFVASLPQTDPDRVACGVRAREYECGAVSYGVRDSE